jgi:hypothetical protein
MTEEKFAIIIASEYDAPDVIAPFDTFDEALRAAHDMLATLPTNDMLQWYYERENLWIGNIRSP